MLRLVSEGCQITLSIRSAIDLAGGILLCTLAAQGRAGAATGSSSTVVCEPEITLLQTLWKPAELIHACEGGHLSRPLPSALLILLYIVEEAVLCLFFRP